jgi:hypothetical protein
MAEDSSTRAPTFEGGSAQKFERWREDFDAFLITKRIGEGDENLAVAYLRLALRGAARDLVEGLGAHDAMQALREAFGTDEATAVPKLQREIQERRGTRSSPS